MTTAREIAEKNGITGDEAASNTAEALDNLTATRLPAFVRSDDAYESTNHPAHYGGEDNPYEAIKVIEAWGLPFHTGNAVKYIARAGRKPGTPYLEDLHKAAWYIAREIERAEGETSR